MQDLHESSQWLQGWPKGSDELKQVWEQSPELYLTTLSGAISAYDENKNIEELLVGCIARLVSVVDEESEITEKALEIVKGGMEADKAS
jgi:hypothetical protein